MIKEISLIAAFWLTAYPAMKAQTGKFLIGGSLGFSYSSDNPVYLGNRQFCIRYE